MARRRREHRVRVALSLAADEVAALESAAAEEERTPTALARLLVIHGLEARAARRAAGASAE